MPELKAPATPSIEPVVIDWFDDRYYQITQNGFTYYLPSVTTKLGIIDKPFLAKWRGDIGNREADLRMHEAGDRGKRIHWAYEIALKGGIVVYNPWQNPIFASEAIQELREQNGGLLALLQTQDEMVQLAKLQKQFDVLKPEVLEIEKKVYDLEHRDAGTIDQVFRIKEGEYLIAGAKPLYLAAGIYIHDLKTGKMVDNNTWLQLAAYAVMYEALKGVQVTGALITHTSANIRGGIQGLKTLVRDRQTLVGNDYPDYRHASALWERNHKDDQPDTFTFPATIQLRGGTNVLRPDGNQANVQVPKNRRGKADGDPATG